MTPSYKSTKIACFVGFVVQAIINNFLPILFIIFNAKPYNLNYEQLGRLLFINFFVQLIVDTATPLIVRKTGYRGAAVICHGLAAFGLCLLGILPALFQSHAYICIVIAIVVYASGSGIIEVCISPIVELLPGDKKGADMAFSHSFYCWGQAFTVLVSTLLIFIMGQDKWYFIPIIWAIIPLINMFNFMRVPIIEDHTPISKTAKSLLKNRDFWLFAIIMICAGASEIAMAEWASLFAQKALGIPKTVGDLLGPCAFAICMGSGRVIFGLLDGKFNPKKALIINNILCIGCYVGVGVFNIPALSLIACALCGFTVSLSWPGTYSMAARHFPTGGTLMFSILALCGDFGCSMGPWLLGIVANKSTLETGFIVLAIFPAIMVITASLLRKEKC